MSSKNPNTAQSYISYIQQNKNSTNYKKDILEDWNRFQERKQLKEQERKREEEEKRREEEEFTVRMNLLNFQLDTLEKQRNQMLGEIDEGVKFNIAVDLTNNPEAPTLPKNINYEEAVKLFDDYDYYVDNPVAITNQNQYKIKKGIEKGEISPYLPINIPSAYIRGDNIIFSNPEEIGYIRPIKGIDEKEAKNLYNQELKNRTQEYEAWKKNTIDIDEWTDNAIEGYLDGYAHRWLDVFPTSKVEQEAYNLGKLGSKSGSFSLLKLNPEDNENKTEVWESLTKSETDDYATLGHIRSITSSILYSLPKDENDNVIINGYSIKPYEAYKQISSIVADKFSTAIMEDNRKYNKGLGRKYFDVQFEKEYGMAFEDYIDKKAESRIYEIIDEIESLKKEVVREYTKSSTNQVMAGMKQMGSLLSWGPFEKPTEAAVEKIIEVSYEQPFEDVLEDARAILETGAWKQFYKGLDAGFDFTNFSTFGLNGLAIDNYKLAVLNKVKNEGESSLSKKEKYMYKLFSLESELANLYEHLNLEKSTFASIGEGLGTTVADAPSFAFGMGITSNIGQGVKYGSKAAFKRFMKQKTFNNAKKLAFKSITDLGKWSAVNYARGAVAAPLMSFTYKSYTDTALQQYSFDEEGNLKFTPKNQLAMAAGAYIDGVNEITSEYFGAGFDDVISLGSKAFGRATGISKVMNKTGVGAWLRRASQSPMSAATKRTFRNLGYTGIISEPLSEVFGDFMSQTMRMGVGSEYSFEHFKDPDYWITTMGVSTLYGGALTTVGAGSNIIKQANYAKKIVKQRNEILSEIDNKELKDKLILLGNSEDFVGSAIELANFNWDKLSPAERSYAINYMRSSYILQTTMGDMEGQRQMEAFEDTMQDLYSRVFINKGKRTGSIIDAIDKKGNSYSILEGDLEDPNVLIKVKNDKGEITEIPITDLSIYSIRNVEEVLTEEYHNRFSTESEIKRLNEVRQSFEKIKNPSEQNIRRITSEFGIRKPEVGKTVKLVDGTEATIKEDLKNGNYIIERQNSETTEQEEIEIPVYSILSNNPITAAAQKKMYEDAKAGYESNNPSAVEEVYKSPEDKIDDIINEDYDSKLFDETGTIKLNNEQIVATFSTEDPNILQDYINKISNKVSPQVKQSLENALKLSKVYNEAITQVSHAVQTKTVKSDVADLTNILRNTVSTSSSQISVEELLESIINDPNISTTVKEDFQNILDSINQNNIHKRATTKTKTSIIQKDVKGKSSEIEEKTPDISQAVTKEMTEEKPIDFSEPTDNTVGPKKEDSITQETEEPIIIPELEEFFAVPDSDKLIETSSEEEQVETLTDEQREEVKVHNEQSTNIIDGIPDSTLPDDVNTDEVIVDKHENQGNRIYRYDGNQLRNNQKQVKRVPNKEGDAHDLLYKWLDENNIDLQGIVDNELAAIAALNTDIRFMMMTEGIKSGYTTGSPMLNTVFQVVEYTDAIKGIHNEKRGGVITFNGKEYLLVGVTGFRTSKEGIFNPEAAHYNFIADKVLKPARNNYVSQTNELNREPYYVHPSVSTKIKTIEAGWLVTQTLKDSETKSRSLGELFEDETRNPHGINTKNSKWLIQTRNSTKPITVRVDNEDIVHSLKVSTGYAGGLFLLVPAANGHHIPVSVKIQTTNELADGTLKDTIWETAQNLLSTEKETRDYAINELCKLLNLTKEGYNIFIDDSEIDFDNPNSAKIIFTHNGTRLSTEISLNSSNASGDLYKTLFSNIPFQLNVGLQTLVSPGELQAYIDAGVLKTDAALLGTTNASYTIHSIGPNLKEDPQQDNITNSQEENYGNSSLQKAQNNGIINYRGHQYYQYTEEQFVDIKAGEIVTNTKEIEEIKNQIWLNKNNPTPARIEPSGERIYIKSANEVISVSKKGIITIYSPKHSISIINEIERLNQEEIRQINAEEALSQVDKLEQERQEVEQEIQDYKADSLQEVNFNEDFDMFNDSEQEVSTIEEESSSQEEEYLIPSEEISGTFTEGVVENSDLNQLSTIEYLSTVEEQLEAEGLSEDTIDSIMEKVYNQLTELGLNSYYSKDQESMIKTIIDKIKNCG